VSAIPALTYHSIAPGEKIGPECFAEHLAALQASGLPSLWPEDLDRARRGFLLTFDDGFADLWTHALPLLRERATKAVVFAIPSRAAEGEPRPASQVAYAGKAAQAHGEGANGEGGHPAFLRWSELRALEATGLVAVQSHSFSHAMGWTGEEIAGFHLGNAGRGHWSLAQCTGGDVRLGIPLYARGSALAHRLYRDDPGLRDHLADWLAERGGEAYVATRGSRAVEDELRSQAKSYRASSSTTGRWETEEDRRRRTLEEIVRARAALEERLGGTRDELCLPWGQYDAATLRFARQAGVRRVYTLDRRPNPAGRIGFLVNRFEPRPRRGAWLRPRLWIYRSTLRTELYGRLSGRARLGEARGR